LKDFLEWISPQSNADNVVQQNGGQDFQSFQSWLKLMLFENESLTGENYDSQRFLSHLGSDGCLRWEKQR